MATTTQTTTVTLPQPPGPRPVMKMTQVRVPVALYKRVQKLAEGNDPSRRVTMQKVIEWGMAEWEQRVSASKKN